MKRRGPEIQKQQLIALKEGRGEKRREFRGKTGEDVAGAGEEEWVCFTIYKGKRILYKLFDGVQTHGSKDKREADNVISGLADLIPFQVKHMFYSAPFDAGAITCLPDQT
ncbi:unnamed protein product [Leuciscus chuanchicus]